MLREVLLREGEVRERVHRAEDLLQEALIKVALRWPKLREGNPDAFVRTVLYRDNVSWWRRRRESPVEQVTDWSSRTSCP